MMERIKHKLTTMKYNRRGFYVFLAVMFAVISVLMFVHDNEIIEGIILFLFIVLGINLGIYLYVEDKEHKIREHLKSSRKEDWIE